MGAADFIRNLLLGSFRNEADAISIYKTHWLPIELAAATASAKIPNCNVSDLTEDMMKAFLKAQPEKTVAEAGAQPVIVGGQLYPRFRKWFRAALAAESSIVLGEDEVTAMERKTAAICRRLQGFAILHFAEDPTERAAKTRAATVEKPSDIRSNQPTFLGSLGSRRPGNGRWRCSRCSFPNEAVGSQCTACSQPKPDGSTNPIELRKVAL